MKLIHYAIIAAIIYFMFYGKKKTENFRGIGMCDKACCATEWIPGSLPSINEGRVTGENGKEYYSSNLTCNGAKGAGCICLTPDARELLKERGFN